MLHAKGVDDGGGGSLEFCEQLAMRFSSIAIVEVSRHDQRVLFALFQQPPADEGGRPGPGLGAAMVEVRVEEQNRAGLRGLAIFQADPGDHPGERTVPTFAADVLGSFTQPEVPAVEFFKSGFAVVESHHLSLIPAVIATHPQHAIAG